MVENAIKKAGQDSYLLCLSVIIPLLLLLPGPDLFSPSVLLAALKHSPQKPGERHPLGSRLVERFTTSSESIGDPAATSF